MESAIIKGRAISIGKRENEYNISTENDPFSWFYRPRKAENHVKIRSDTINPLEEHSIDKLNSLEKEMMIGEGVRKLKMADLKQVAKYYNGLQSKSEMKIKGYGKMKKRELRANIVERLRKEIS